MLQVHPPNTRHAFEKATDAREKARTAKDAESRLFWEEMEARWLHLAGVSQFVEQLTDYIKSKECP